MDLTFNESTDTENEETLDSSLIAAMWTCGRAIAGQRAGFAVSTALVGDGAPVEVKGESEGGTPLGTIKGKVRRNTFFGTLEIPANIRLHDAVFFEARLSKHGLEARSSSIPVFPPIEVTDLKWSAAEARRGDVLTLSAKVKGLPEGSDVEVVIFEHDADGAHDRIAQLPGTVADGKVEVRWEYEYHDDTDDLPTEDELQPNGGQYHPPEYFFTVRVDSVEFGRQQESGLLQFKDWLEIELVPRDGVAAEGERYVLHLPDGTQREGTLDRNGCAREVDVPPGPFRVEFPDAHGVARTGDG